MSAIQDEISGEVKMQQRSPDGLAQSLVNVNQLGYRMPANMSVVVNRTMSRSYANLDTYSPGGKIIVTFNTGSTYVWGRTSYLTFDVAVSGTGADPAKIIASLESGSAINLIDSVTVYSQSGTEVDRTEGVNLHARNQDRYTFAQDWVNNFGSVIGYGSTEKTGFGTTDPVVITPVASLRFCIPLSHLAGIFGGSVLMPSMLAGGLRLEIKLAPLAVAFKDNSITTIPDPHAVTNYTVTNASCQLDTFQLADSIQKRLMMEAASTGLEFYYETWDRTRHNISASDKANITIRKSVARALSAFAVTRETSKTASLAEDSMASENGANIDGMFWRLGSLTFPQQKLENTAELYYYAQRAFQKVESPYKMNSISLDDFKGSEALAAVTLERSNVLELSGLPVNNSRSLQLELDYSSSANRDIDVYMHYVQLARVFVNNVLVKE